MSRRHAIGRTGLCALLLAGLGASLGSGCQRDLDAAAWHERGHRLLGDVAVDSLRALPRPTLASALYCQQQAVARDSSLREALLGLARLHEALGHFEAATAHWRNLVQRQADDPVAYAGLGTSLAAQGRFSGALRAYQDALRRSPDPALQLTVYNSLGHAYQALGHEEHHLRSAEATYSASLRLEPDQPEILYQLARVLTRQERPDEALLLYRKAQELAPDDIGIRVELAAAYEQAGRPAAAEAALRSGLEMQATPAEHAALHFEIGRLAFADGRTDVALAAFRDAGGLDPTLTMADRFAARILAEQGRPAEALTLYAALRERLPDDAEPRVAAGIVLSGMGRLEEAEVAFREALSMDRTGDAAVKLGGLYVHQGRLREAQRIYLQGADQHPENAELHASLGDVYLRLGVLGGALRAAERAAELEPDSPVWQFHLARVYERVHPEAAVAAWRRYLELAQDRPEETQRRQIAAERLAQAR